MTRKKILVIGANGFTGRRILDDLSRNLSYQTTGCSLHHVIEQAGEVARDAIYQNALYPFLDDLTNQAKIPPFPRPPM